jgi:hypothetical protein
LLTLKLEVSKNMKAYPDVMNGRALLKFVNRSAAPENLRSAIMLNAPKAPTADAVPSLFQGNQPVPADGGEFPVDITAHLLRFPSLRDGTGVLRFSVLWIEQEDSHEAEYVATLENGEVLKFGAA